jgi:FMN phosphatase YigB (HAD superfamily)
MGFMKSDKEFWAMLFSHFPEKAPDEFVMVGDNPSRDTYWPNLLGMGTILIKTSEQLPIKHFGALSGSYKPNYYVADLQEIAQILLNPRPTTNNTLSQ